MQRLLEKADSLAAKKASEVLLSGGLVAFPTETVYGVGAIATDDKAVARVYSIKNRPRFNPLIAHVSDRASAAVFAAFDERALNLAEAFWPGPLTLVLPLKVPSAISTLATVGLQTVAVRVPSQKFTLELLKQTELPVVAPSANSSGFISPTRAEHVVRSLVGSVDMIVDGGSCEFGLESTIIDLSKPANPACVLRFGAIDTARIEEVLKEPLAARGNGFINAPGMLTKHYAPRKPLYINRTGTLPGEGLLAFGPDVPKIDGPICNLSVRGDLTEAAHNLYTMMRKLDDAECEAIAAMPIPDLGIGRSINDRLSRASINDDSNTLENQLA